MPGNRSAVIPLKRGRSAAVSLATFTSFMASRRTLWRGGREGRGERGGENEEREGGNRWENA